MFPAYKDSFKIIVAEINDCIVFALHLFISKEDKISGSKSTGHIYDFLMNPNIFSQLDNPTEVQVRMIYALELIAWINKCKEIQTQDGTIGETILKNKQFVKQGNMWKKFIWFLLFFNYNRKSWHYQDKWTHCDVMIWCY